MRHYNYLPPFHIQDMNGVRGKAIHSMEQVFHYLINYNIYHRVLSRFARYDGEKLYLNPVYPASFCSGGVSFYPFEKKYNKLFFIVDNLGEIVSYDYFIAFYEEHSRNHSYRRKRPSCSYLPNIPYRKAPVPHTAKRKFRKGGSYFRKIGTHQERKAALECEYGGVKVRAKRRLSTMPTSFDDIPRRDVDDRSWKRHRRKQYKE